MSGREDSMTGEPLRPGKGQINEFGGTPRVNLEDFPGVVEAGIGSAGGGGVETPEQRVAREKSTLVDTFFIEQVQGVLSRGNFDQNELVARFENYLKNRRSFDKFSDVERISRVEGIGQALGMVAEVRRFENQNPDLSYDRKRQLMVDKQWKSFDGSLLDALSSMRNGEAGDAGVVFQEALVRAFKVYNNIGFGKRNIAIRAGTPQQNMVGWEALATEMRNQNLDIAIISSVAGEVQMGIGSTNVQAERLSRLAAEVALKLWTYPLEMGELAFRMAKEEGRVVDKKPAKNTFSKITTYSTDRNRPLWLDRRILNKIGDSPIWFLCDTPSKANAMGMSNYTLSHDLLRIDWGDPMMENPFELSDKSFLDGSGIIDLARRITDEPDKINREAMYKGLVKSLLDLNTKLKMVNGGEARQVLVFFALGYLAELKEFKLRQEGGTFDLLDAQSAVSRVIKGAERRGEEVIYLLPRDLEAPFDVGYKVFAQGVVRDSRAREIKGRVDAAVKTTGQLHKIAASGILGIIKAAAGDLGVKL